MADHDGPEKGGRARTQRFHGRVEAEGRACDHPGCPEPGEFRGPSRAPTGVGPVDRRWYCLEHVREENTRYNFFSGMSPDQIYDAQRPVAGWERETRAFSSRGDTPRWADFADPLDAIGVRFGESVADRLRAREAAAKRGRPLDPTDAKALKTLGLQADADRTIIRRSYLALVRRYHPDRNGGDRSHEKALQDVIAAYTHLKKGARLQLTELA